MAASGNADPASLGIYLAIGSDLGSLLFMVHLAPTLYRSSRAVFSTEPIMDKQHMLTVAAVAAIMQANAAPRGGGLS